MFQNRIESFVWAYFGTAKSRANLFLNIKHACIMKTFPLNQYFGGFELLLKLLETFGHDPIGSTL